MIYQYSPLKIDGIFPTNLSDGIKNVLVKTENKK